MGHFTISPTIVTMIIIVRAGIFALGGLITYFNYKAYRSTGAASLRTPALGFGVVTLGATLGGILDVILNVNLATGLLIDLVLAPIGFATITYSLYAN